MNKKGFTLIELLGTIVVLGIIASIAIVAIMSILNSSKEKAYVTTESNIVAAGVSYANENSSDYYPMDDDYEYQCITVQELMDLGYFKTKILESEVKDGDNVIKVSPTMNVFIKRNQEQKTIDDKYLVKSSNDPNGEYCPVIDTCPLVGGYYGTYDGKPHGIKVYDETENSRVLFRKDGETEWTTTTETRTDAGGLSYDVKVVDKKGRNIGCLSEDTSSATVYIGTKKITLNWEGTEFNYDGSSQGPTATAETGVEGETIEIETTKETTVGNHISMATCKKVTGGQENCDNYYIENSTKQYSINYLQYTLTFNITQNGIGSMSRNGSTYYGNMTLTCNLIGGNTCEIVAPTIQGYWKLGSTNYDSGATITVTAAMNGKTLYATRNPVAIPTNTYCVSRTYTGGEQTLTKAAGEGYTFSNNRKTNAGTYSVTATLKNGYEWTDGTTGTKSFNCTIERKSVEQPGCSEKKYNGSTQTLFSANAESNQNSKGFWNTAVTGKNAGSYTTMLRLSPNYKWSTGTYTTTDRSITCKIYIIKYRYRNCTKYVYTDWKLNSSSCLNSESELATCDGTNWSHHRDHVTSGTSASEGNISSECASGYVCFYFTRSFLRCDAWGTWSNWSTTKPTATSTRQVESQKFYE